MTKAERADLARVIRGREKLAKAAATQRAQPACRADHPRRVCINVTVPSDLLNCP
jgi:hypothetical protein